MAARLRECRFRPHKLIARQVPDAIIEAPLCGVTAARRDTFLYVDMQKLSELKWAISVLPSADVALDAIKNVLPSALLIGGGVAGAKHLVSNYRSNKKDEEIDSEKNKNVLVVRIPRKTASSVWDGGLRSGTAILGTLGGYSLVDSLINRKRVENKEEELNRLKDEYSRLLGASMIKRSSTEALNLPDFPAITGLCMEFLEQRDGAMLKKADVAKDFIGIPLTLAAISGIISHNWMYKKQKELEKMHTAEKPSPPKQIRFETYDPDQDPDEEASDNAMKIAADGDHKKILSSSGIGSALGDYIYPFDSYRAGKAKGMATATGEKEEDIPLEIRYPKSTVYRDFLLGLLSGGVVGGAGGAIGGTLIAPDKPSGQPLPTGTIAGGTYGMALGAAAGGLIGAIRNAVKRHRYIKEIAKRYDETPEEQRKLNVRDADQSVWRDVLLPFGGFHRKGQREVFRDITEGTKMTERAPVLESSTIPATILTEGYGAIPLGMAAGLMTNENTGLSDFRKKFGGVSCQKNGKLFSDTLIARDAKTGEIYGKLKVPKNWFLGSVAGAAAGAFTGAVAGGVAFPNTGDKDNQASRNLTFRAGITLGGALPILKHMIEERRFQNSMDSVMKKFYGSRGISLEDKDPDEMEKIFVKNIQFIEEGNPALSTLPSDVASHLNKKSGNAMKIAADAHELIDMEYPHRKAPQAMPEPLTLMRGLKFINAGAYKPPFIMAGYPRQIWANIAGGDAGSFVKPEDWGSRGMELRTQEPNNLAFLKDPYEWLMPFLRLGSTTKSQQPPKASPQDKGGSSHLNKKGNVELLAFLGPSAAMGSDAVKESEEDRKKRLRSEELEKIRKGTQSIDVAPGVQKVISGDNVVELEAQDPEAKKLLAANASRIRQLIGAFESTSPDLR